MSNIAVFNSELTAFLQERAISLFGFADLSPIPDESKYGFPRSISFGFTIKKAILKQIRHGPTPEYYEEYKRLNANLATTAKELETYILYLGYSALAIDDNNRKYDAKSLTTLLPHKTSATLSGLGWIGKCNLLVTEEFGSGIRLGTVLTNIPLKAGNPIFESKCGECKTCYTLSPAKAITGRNWKRGMGRDEIYEAHSCKAMATRLSDAIRADHTICGICIANCPICRVEASPTVSRYCSWTDVQPSRNRACEFPAHGSSSVFTSIAPESIQVVIQARLGEFVTLQVLGKGEPVHAVLLAPSIQPFEYHPYCQMEIRPDAP